MDRGRLPCNVAAGQAGRRDRAVARAGRHGFGHDAHGSVAGLRRLGAAAKAEARVSWACAGHQIRDLRLGGTEVTSEVRIPRLAYLGDSSPGGLDACPAMFEAEVLIMELTFVSPRHRKDKIHKFGHMHLDDLLERRDKFHNELVIASHFSTRYHPNQIRDCVGEGPARHARRPAAFVALGPCRRGFAGGMLTLGWAWGRLNLWHFRRNEAIMEKRRRTEI